MNDDNRQDDPQRDFGPQPLEAILHARRLSNHDLVDASGGQLTHKMVARGRKGRRLTRNVQRKIVAALNAITAHGTEPQAYAPGDLFNYPGA